MSDDCKLTPLEHLNVLQKIAKRNTEFLVEKIIIDISYKFLENALKALEIIKEKEVNVFIFLHSGDLETYNDMVEDNRKLTQEEYDLLKEVLL